MIAIPAVDLRDGACVQLVGGSYEEERVRLPDPLAVARRWADAGFKRLHVVDLDAATGVGSNASVVDELIARAPGAVQVGGGIRTRERIAALIARGANVIVGTKAIDDAVWLAQVAGANPGRIVVAADVRGRAVVTHGWAREREIDVVELVDRLVGQPLAGILVTAVHREGLMGGTDLPLMEEIASRTRIPVIASGGIHTISELRALDAVGVSAAVLGMSLYTGALDPRAVAREFA